MSNFAERRRATEAERQQRLDAQRLDLAQELHDVLAHTISLINVQASVALHLLDQQPERARPALTEIKQHLLALRRAGKLDRVKMLLLTNCTFDGIVYDVGRVMEECLAIKPDLIFLWDEAWFAFARFHPVYRPRTAMRAARTLIEKLRLPGYRASYEAQAEQIGPVDAADDSILLSRRLIEALAHELGAKAFFPFGGPPFWPFQQWARRAEPVHPSPIGILIHPRYGLWHSYRGALGFGEKFAAPEPATIPSPCDSCIGRWCLKTCPVGAFSPSAYDVAACVGHVKSAAGADCMGFGCRARRACPVGPEYAYDPEQANFFMRAFLRGQQAG